MAKVEVEIEDIVKNLASGVSFLQPVYESIVNSLEANATQIDINFLEDAQTNLDIVESKINGFIITDNGNGFTKDNIESFKKLWTTHKIKLGCKGSGRFTWLNVFKKIDIRSELSEENKIVSIPFSINYGNSDIKVTDSASVIEQNKTVITFKDVTDRIYNNSSDKRLRHDYRESANLSVIKEKITENLLIKLFLLKQKGINYRINLRIGGNFDYIDNNTIPKLDCLSFDIEPQYKGIDPISFELYYRFLNDGKKSKKIYLCANERVVKKLDDDDLGFSASLPNNDSFDMLLCSEYLNNNVDDNRNKFSGLEGLKQSNFDKPLLMSTIISKMKEYMNSIILNKYENLLIINKEIKSQAIEQEPHLSKYINDNTDLLISTNSLITDAKRKFIEQKESIRNKFSTLLKKADIDDIEFNKTLKDFSEIALTELGEYIAYRKTIINALGIALENKDKNEDFIHNIFMPKNTTNSSNANIDYTLNNLWLLDDKFMTYSYVASDTTIKKIIDEIEAKDKEKFLVSKKPDLTIFYNKKNIKDLVVVEFKGITATLGEKEKSISELPRNVQILRQNIDNISTVWSYIIAPIDSEFENSLTASEFKPMFTNNESGKMFYRFYSNNNAHVFAIDLETIVKDSECRNKTFLEILKNK